MRLDTKLLNEVYRIDPFFKKLKEVYDKYKNHRDKSKHIVNNQKDILQLRLQSRFIKIPNILIEQLTEVNFSCKECFKIFLLMYRISLRTREMSFICKKEYLRSIIKIHRNVLERGLKELKEKNMVLSEKVNGGFRFTVNLCFIDWNIQQLEKVEIKENIENEITWYQEKFIQEEDIF